MQNNDVKNANKSSVETQKQQHKKDAKDLNHPAQKPATGAGRIDQSDDKFSSSQPSRNK